MNIAMYLGSAKGNTVNALHPESGNPGVGGTQYCFLMLAHYLHAYGINVTLLAVREYASEEGVGFIRVGGDHEVVDAAEAIDSDILILRDFPGSILMDHVSRTRLKVIVWSHNYIYSDFCDYISRTPQVKCNVFVGRQQYDRYLDDDVIRKSVAIHNMFKDSCAASRNNDCRTVVYMGSIVEGKGFYELCRIWKGILREVPDARLLVLGSGKLYGETRLGPAGIASESYERKFMPFITDDNGEILPSVQFLGILGPEKTDIFLNSSVGVVNPSARTETFGMGIVEMASASLPVVTLGANGHYDTVVDGVTGILSSSLSGIQKEITNLLKDSEMNRRLGHAAKNNIVRFAPEDIIESGWLPLLNSVYCDYHVFPTHKASRPYSNNFKWLRVANRFLRFKLRLGFLPSVVKLESFAARVLRYLR